MNPGDEIAQGVSQGVAGLNPVTKMLGMAQQGGDQIIQLLQQLGLIQPPQGQMMPVPGQGNPLSGVGAAPQMPPQGLKGRMTGGK